MKYIKVLFFLILLFLVVFFLIKTKDRETSISDSLSSLHLDVQAPLSFSLGGKTDLVFSIKNKIGQNIRSFDTVHEKQIAIRN